MVPRVRALEPEGKRETLMHLPKRQVHCLFGRAGSKVCEPLQGTVQPGHINLDGNCCKCVKAHTLRTAALRMEATLPAAA